MKNCINKNCSNKAHAYRNYCFDCVPKKKPGRKSMGNRKQYNVNLNQKQQIMLENYYDGSLQKLVNSVLDWQKKALTKKSS